MAETMLDVALQDLLGVGAETEKKLIHAGIESVLDLAAALPDEVMEAIWIKCYFNFGCC